ncbi:hypothetical protein SLEP1_g37810 [Rubroshorea leprosula]|uniref:Uncharacterized protein n=1 Tax=Rubroshorea leprosula TaxID=152421 RepID=A0AAV5KWE2_9ROSI|nr:hypothetical protein SLEP1_g37810 [Rubroshorea leprosula]
MQKEWLQSQSTIFWYSRYGTHPIFIPEHIPAGFLMYMFNYSINSMLDTHSITWT